MAKKNNEDRGLYERVKGSGEWHVEWYDHRGKRRRHLVGSKDEARRYRKDVLALVDLVKRGKVDEQRLVDNEYLLPEDLLTEDTEPAELTLGDFIEDCSVELSQLKSWKDLKGYAAKWIKIVGDLALTDPSIVEHATKHRAARLGKVKPATANREVEFLRSIYGRAVQRGLLEKNPLSRLKDLPEDNRRIRFLTHGEEARLLQSFLELWEDGAERFELVIVAMDTGIRRERMFQLPWKHVNLENHIISVVGAKAGSDRDIPMTDRVREILERRFATRESHFVFSSIQQLDAQATSEGARNGANFVRRCFKKALAHSGVEEFVWHDLRHTFCSRLAMRGVPLQVIKDLAGHSDFKTTLRYAHLAPDNLKAGIAALNATSKTGLRIVK